MSSVSPVKPPKKKKRTKSKKGGQEDNMASNMNTTMTGPAPSIFQHPCTSPVPTQQQHYHQSAVDPQFYASTHPTHMQQNFQPNIQSNIPNNNIPSPSTGVPPQWALDIFSRLDGISRRLEKLDSIQSSISAIQREVKTLSSRVGEVEKSQEFLSKTVEENKQKTEGNSCVMSRLKLELEESIKLNAQMKEEILDLQCRSMRDNLLFYNIKEAQNKETEDCVRIIQDICSSELEIMEDVSIERAHRIGKRESGKIRPIVVKFTRFPQRELVRKSAFKLKNTDLSISEQFPREIQDRRKQLLPVLKQAKANNRKTVFVKDKLFIDGRLYRQDQGTTPLPNRKGSQSR